MIAQGADLGTVSEAARRIGITQSALSHRIREAERLLSTTLFHRENNLLIPTNTGKRLLHTARVVLKEIEHAERDINNLSEGVDQVVRLGVDAYCNYHWLPGFLRIFEDDYPTIGTAVIADVSQAPYSAMRTDHIDVAIVAGTVRLAGLNATKLFRDKLVAVLPSEHGLAKNGWLTPEDLANETCIVHNTVPEQDGGLTQFFGQDIVPRKMISAGVTDAIIAFVSQGKGIALLPRWTVKTYLGNDKITTSRLTKEGIDIDWHAIVRESEPAGSPADKFVKALLEDCSLFRGRPSLALLA
jgi:LysR family transcriptional regulator for metE and metH